MKKFFLLFITLAAVLALASCSDDKKAWEQIPSSPITGNDAELTYNGDRSYGVFLIDTRSETDARVTLSNVIPGYPEIEMPVTMKQTADDAFSLSGTLSLSAPPVMMPSSKAQAVDPIYTLSLTGTVTTGGKAMIAVNSELTSAAQGNFTGKWTPEKMLPVSPALIEYAPVVVDMAIKGMPEKSAELSQTLSLLGGLAFYNTVGAIDFRENGNVVVDYATTIDLARAMQEAIDEQNGIYKAISNFDGTTGQNLVFWYSRTPMLMITPYIPGISYKIDVDNGRNPNLNDGATAEKLQNMIAELGKLGIDTKALLSTFSALNASGIPMAAQASSSALKIMITKEMLDPFMKLLAPALPALDEKLTAYLSDPANAAVAEIITTRVMPALGVKSLVELGELWENGIETFTITLNLVK